MAAIVRRVAGAALGLFVAIGAAEERSEVRTRLEPGDLAYVGAFAAPEGDGWAWGGHAMAYVPVGDPGGPPDGFPGSLYLAGNGQQDLVGEIAIPAPAASSSFGELPRATVLRPLADLTQGLLTATCTACPSCDCASWDIGGLEYLPGVDRIAWTIQDWYNAGGEDLDDLGWSTRDMSAATGVWHIGPRPNTEWPHVFHNAKTADYLLTAPTAFADQHLGGRTLIAGYHRESGALGGSQGPTFYATAPWLDGSPPAPGTDLGATALVHYRWYLQCTDSMLDCELPGYRVDDQWGGAAWVESGSRSAIVMFGLKGLGDNCYGDPGVECPAPACNPDRGYHADPYQPQMLLYDPTDLAAVAAGLLEPWQVQPYQAVSLVSHVFDPDCAPLAAVAFDRERGLIYVAESQAGPDGDTAVHVWRLTGALFRDGFESGGTGAWSSVAGG